MSIPSTSKCFVTGATNPTSIGYATALRLLKAGASHVTIMGRDQGKLNEAITLLAGENLGKVDGILGDLKQPETMNKVIETVCNSQMMGGLDILVICGGNGYSEYLGLDVAELESYRMMQNVAVLSPMVLAEAAVTYLSKSNNPGGGTIVMVGSVSADIPWPNTAPHNIAMAARNAMVQTLAFKYRDNNVRVNIVGAGVIHTGALDVMAKKKNQSVEDYAALRATAQPLGRNGTPDDVANAVVFLASPASGFTTGEILRVDGGLHLSNWWNQQAMIKEYVGGTD
jgi:NAD(P)-dependent dehydrogenase (short-subunit alcohol dehydrogenase family)